MMGSNRTFGGVKGVPALGLGTWQMEGDDRRAAVEALRAGIALGMTHIDTAELYGSGQVEELVGEAIAGERDRIFLVSKVMPSNATRRGTVRACEASLKRLGTDRLDCYLLHWPGRHPLEDTIAAFEELRESGKIRAWGVSNFDADELDDALRIAGPGKIACNQVLYNLAQRDIEDKVVPWCEAHDVAVTGYTPFGTKFPPSGPGAKVLSAVAQRRGVSPRQVALAFLTRKPSLFGIPKAAKVQHVEENAAAADLTLDEADLAELDRAFPVPKQTRGVPML